MLPNIDQETRVINDPSAPLPDKIAAAAVLWDFIDRSTKVLERFKAEVRVAAAESKLPVVTLNGTGMSQCKVVFPGPTLKLNDPFDAAAARRVLGPFFDPIFETHVTLRSNDPNTITPFPPNVAVYMAGVTTLVPSTPRVSLKMLPGVEEVR